MSGSVSIHTQPGRLPPPRAGSVAFFANLSHIFFDNEGLTESLRAEVEGLETYGGRLLPIVGLLWSGADNLLVMEREPHAGLPGYFRERLGLRLPEVLVCGAELPPDPTLVRALKDKPGRLVDGFVTDRKLAGIAAEAGLGLAGTVEGSLRGNNKLLLHEFLAAAGEPVFETLFAETPDDVGKAAAELARRGYRQAVAKAQIGASGIGLVRFETAEAPVLPPPVFRDGKCLVQGWLDEAVPEIERVASPSVQMLIAAAGIELYDLTDQILSPRSIHEGNVSPPPSLANKRLRDEVLRQAGVAARWLHAQGYRGTASADFHLAFWRGGHVEVRVCELNARVTGATYPSLLARHFAPGGAWLMRNLRLPEAPRGKEIFEELDDRGLLYQTGMDSGVLPINFNSKLPGRITKGQFLFI
ncbi:MAG: hypothetical protein KDN05_15280, partial [Verrucomicrobiae bacterium]|nr:hypothetical protein [Verrucomicrobiae bacterium]